MRKGTRKVAVNPPLEPGVTVVTLEPNNLQESLPVALTTLITPLWLKKVYSKEQVVLTLIRRCCDHLQVNSLKSNTQTITRTIGYSYTEEWPR